MTVDVQFACEDAGVPDKHAIQEWVELAASRSGRLPDGDVDFAVRIVREAEIQTLNQLYRNKDAATNVLSFPGTDAISLQMDAPRGESAAGPAPILLGDVVVAFETTAAEAASQGDDGRSQGFLILQHLNSVTLTGAMLPENPAGPAFGYMQPLTDCLYASAST